MDKIERMIKALSHHKNFIIGDKEVSCEVGEVIEALEGLRPVKPAFSRMYNEDIAIYSCGACGKEVGADCVNYCPHCGRKVKWNG